ncbi:MAG TPA: acyl-CoA thioesterase [Holophagaceae bacterium]|jgi:acyl-CoA thioester hydrolase|nr:acyl-CoA thioesterase [Holophagaceae bacterium]
MTAALRAEIQIEIPFHDVDVMGIVWHGHYIKYFEIARTALLRKADMDLDAMALTGCAWPVVTCEIKYIKPLRYGQRVRVEAAFLEYEDRLKIAYTVRDLASGERLTRATTVQLAVDAKTGELGSGTPEVVMAAIERAMADAKA